MHRLKAHTPTDRPSIPASGSRRRRSRTGSEISNLKSHISEAYNQNSLFVSKNHSGRRRFAVNRKAQDLNRTPGRFQAQNPPRNTFFCIPAIGPAGRIRVTSVFAGLYKPSVQPGSAAKSDEARALPVGAWKRRSVKAFKKLRQSPAPRLRPDPPAGARILSFIARREDLGRRSRINVRLCPVEDYVSRNPAAMRERLSGTADTLQ
jgi:hypothetical protein